MLRDVLWYCDSPFGSHIQLSSHRQFMRMSWGDISWTVNVSMITFWYWRISLQLLHYCLLLNRYVGLTGEISTRDRVVNREQMRVPASEGTIEGLKKSETAILDFNLNSDGTMWLGTHWHKDLKGCMNEDYKWNRSDRRAIYYRAKTVKLTLRRNWNMLAHKKWMEGRGRKNALSPADSFYRFFNGDRAYKAWICMYRGWKFIALNFGKRTK